MNDEIMVSVCCLVYNHEKYLRQCLDGFMMQKTNFKFEVLIHDDASTDGSSNIIREYELKYPEIIKPIYQTENQYSKGVKISWLYQYPRAKGKYIALCEGDDYWTNPYKLQKQFDSLENNTNCVFCSHIVNDVSESGDSTNQFHPRKKIQTQIIPGNRIIMNFLSASPEMFQTSSYFFRKKSIGEYIGNPPDFIRLTRIGDTPTQLLLASKGDFLFLNEIMSCYRINSENSWSSQQKNNPQKQISTKQSAITYFRSYDVFTNKVYCKEIEKKCAMIEFEILRIKNDYKSMLKKKNKLFFCDLPKKEKIYIRIGAVCPSIIKYYKKHKRRKNDR